MEAFMKNRSFRAGVAAAALAVIVIPLVAWAQQKAASPQSGAPSSSEDPASLPDQQIGRRFTIKAEDLPPPNTGPVVASRSLTLPYQGQVPRVPDGFTVSLF